MICITGSPGTGKTTVALFLSGHGIRVSNVMDIPGARECVTGDEADLSCLERIIQSMDPSPDVLEGHYSHLLGCEAVVILERNPERISEVLAARGYSQEKIMENLESQMVDVYYQESLDLMPISRIFRVHVIEDDIQSTGDSVLLIVKSIREGLRKTTG